MQPPANRHSRAIELQMTPMVDVVFLLLIFFLWTTSFEVPEQDLSGAIATPPAAAAQAIGRVPAPLTPFDEIVIRLIQPAAAGNAEIYFNDSAVSPTELAARISEIASLGAQPPVIVDCDAAVSMGDAIAVYDTIQAAGMDRVLFAARE
jgi:biopolymer transport protein ExbD